jgi:hypothetical protein
MAEAGKKAKGPGQALLGSIQGTETATRQGWQLQGSGGVQPLGDVSVTGFLGYGHPGPKTGGAVGGSGTMRFSNAQGSVTLAMKSHGYFPLFRQNAEEIRVTVQTRSATGAYAGIHVAGTINLVNPFIRTVAGANPPVHISAQINLKPAK